MKRLLVAILSVLTLLAFVPTQAHALHSTAWATQQACNASYPYAIAAFAQQGWPYWQCTTVFNTYWDGASFHVSPAHLNGAGCPGGIGGWWGIYWRDVLVGDNGSVNLNGQGAYGHC